MEWLLWMIAGGMICLVVQMVVEEIFDPYPSLDWEDDDE